MVHVNQGARGLVHPVDLVRLAWGTVLLLRPRPLLSAVGAPPNHTRAVVVARVLGARHVGQALVLLGTTWSAQESPVAATRAARVRRAGAAVDGLHALTALGLASTGVARRAWGANTLTASAFALATWHGVSADQQRGKEPHE